MNVSERLELSRRELLDLTLRNPLLNYRLLKSKGIEIVDEIPEELYRILVTEGKAMTFLPMENRAGVSAEEGEEENFRELQDSYSDLKIQTSYSEKELQTRLLQTYLSARTFIEEQGVNILFVSVGMLKWKEIHNEKEFKAPLILIPVELNRSNARSRFTLNYTGEDVLSNLSLSAKLKSEYNIDLPLIEEMEDFSVNGYLELVIKSVENHVSWKVCDNDIAIGFFSYSKYLMFNDLDLSKWRNEDYNFEHSILESLLIKGFNEINSKIDDDEYIDKHINPKDTFHIVEADSSQILAMSDINIGRNLVIQGPPGTGKSQTITNIIAEAIGRGKKVLFVAEKMAALEVVKRRLDNVGLGDACLELHSNKTNKKAVLSELERVLELGRPKLMEMDAQFEKLNRSRNYLNDYCKAVNEPIGDTGISPFYSYGELLRIMKIFEKKDVELPELNTKQIETMNKIDFERKLELIKEMEAHINIMGVPQKHAFWSSKLESFLPSDKIKIGNTLKKLNSSYATMKESLKVLVAFLKVEASEDFNTLTQLLITAKRLIEAPSMEGVNVRSEGWSKRISDIYKIIETGKKFSDIRNKYSNIVIEEAWDVDLLEIRQMVVSYKDKWWRIFSGDYRKANNKFIGLLKGKSKLTIDEKIKIIDAIMEAKRQQNFIKENSNFGSELFNEKWQGTNSNWEDLSIITPYLVKIHYDIHQTVNVSLEMSSELEFENCKLTDDIFSFIEAALDKETVSKYLNNVIAGLLDYEDIMKDVIRLIKLDLEQRFNGMLPIKAVNFIELENIMNLWEESFENLQQIVVYNYLNLKLQEEQLEDVAEFLEGWSFGGELAREAFIYQRCEKLVEKAFSERKVLTVFDGNTHEHEIENFCNLDESLLKMNRIRLAYEHWQSVPKTSSGEGQLGVLLWEFQKKSRHLPIRKLISKAGNVIQAIKPVMMMSPLSIANFIEPGTLQFDLVIFDEASQVRPVEAFGALMRAKQAVVVGDSNQMPPTSFFDFVIGANEAEDNTIADVESILALFAAQGAPQRMLRWHYRSKDQSLIMVSNREFYKNKLVVFPDVEANNSEYGLIYRYLPNTAYDRGGSRTNIKEAKILAKRIMKHAKEYPQLTLGVAAFSVAQMQAIYDELEVLRRADSSFENFFKSHTEEPFFVKNLENIQGDERDVIFISIGYGKTADGSLAMDFGPLNRDGGERRLNVLITRARQRCEVFTNLAPEDIDLGRTSARGVECLKTFLTYARDKKLNIDDKKDESQYSGFETEVYIKLQEAGYKVHKHVGTTGFYIDLAVIDPNKPGKYLLGIECDGDTYNSAKSARDRDRLRQKVLIEKGWKLYKIWSTDWFRNPKKQLKKLLDVIAELKEHGYEEYEDNEAYLLSDEFEEVIIERADFSEDMEEVLIPLYEFTDTEFEYTDAFQNLEDTCQCLVEVVSAESPIHILEALKRVMSLSGTKRAGSIIQEKFDKAVQLAIESELIVKKGDFLWYPLMTEIPLRNRRNLPPLSKKLEYIADEEIAIAVRHVIDYNFGMAIEDVPSAACKLLGFSRVTEEMNSRVMNIIHMLEVNTELVKQGDNLIVNK
jgi:very-short-patch-repair endonuclease